MQVFGIIVKALDKRPAALYIEEMENINRENQTSKVLAGFKFLISDKEVQVPQAKWTKSNIEELETIRFPLILLNERYKFIANGGVPLYAWLGWQVYDSLLKICSEVYGIEQKFLRFHYHDAKLYRGSDEDSPDLVSVGGA